MNLKRFFLFALILSPILLSAFTTDNVPRHNDYKFVVVLDAGHGGHDPGNLGNGYLEKDIALKIVLNVGKILESNPDIKVIYTRKDDTFVDLFVRGEIANKANADLFVSVHCDSHSSDAHGAGTFVLGLHANKQNFEIAKKENSVIYLEDNYEDRYAAYDINSPESIIGLTIMQEEFLDQSIALAKMIQDNFSGKLNRVNRKVKQAGFIVLHQTFMPSVLVETGFLTNKSEGAYLNSKKGQAEIAKAIADAVLIYKISVHTGAPVQPNVPQEIVQQEEEPLPVKKDKPNIVAPTPKEANNADQHPVVPKDEPKEKEIAATPKTVAKESVGKKEVSVAETGSPVKKAANPGISFKVQIMASSKNLKLIPQNFKGLGNVSRESFNNLYRYMYGKTESFEEAKMLKSNADLKGFTGAYIVAYKEGERIPVTEALKYVSE
ncbi:N-acetylmuramoyl-L-alanine amidase [Maribacter polysaccharolyticus]|uniref:N-acetylmuramoyl-L-alanine amidase n=1 Tax=Maribacter polysaccharolyticus TaxID=3020831 RepID=UPI00237F8D94|nr:N-acetylmuramoyl-L-alanine amidase [Maribacter polysaccharolyticus]MDE3743539.1 N-acetylmuramoyl-L-alanine amidase [Maribacter polysaccharolyticus]